LQDNEKQKKFERLLQRLVDKDRAAAVEDLPQITQEMDLHIAHLKDLQGIIDSLVLLPDPSHNNRGTELDTSLFRDKAT
jgi:hypothetical protein